LTYDEKKVIAGIAGAAGAVFANPFEIIMVRQISDLGRPAEFRRGYVDIVDAYSLISKEAGFGIWRGLSAHVAKAVVLNTGNPQTITLFLKTENSHDWTLRYDERESVECLGRDRSRQAHCYPMVLDIRRCLQFTV
jgi:hypothetical protein